MKPFACQRCGASLVPPEDLALVSMGCGYCGQEQPIPNLQERVALFELKRADEQQARMAAERRQSHVEARLAEKRETKSIVKWVVLAVLFGVGMSVLGVVIDATTPKSTPGAAPVKKPTDDASTGLSRVKKMVKQRKKKGCSVVNEADVANDDLTASGMKIPSGACVTVIVSTGVDGNDLTLQFRDDKSAPYGDSSHGTEVVDRLCSHHTAEYGYTVTTSLHMPFAYAEMECPKD